MALTINGSGPWKYLDLVNECIRILLTIALGSASSGLGIFDVKTFVPVATRFVFYVALPLLVVRGLGVGIDFYDDSFSWTFIGVFLILRVIALCFAIGCAWLQGEGIGQLTVIWLGLSWISTVILGIPIANAVFGSPQLGLAGISSFIFQLPVQLLFLECHALQQDEHALPQRGMSIASAWCMDDVEAPTFDASTPQEQPEIPIRAAPVVSIPIQDVDVGASRIMQLPSFVFRRDVWMSIANKIFCNPVFIAILCGFFLSLSTLGPRFLNPSSNDYIPGLGWFWTTTQWLGACVSPVSLFAMGVWMYESRAKLFLVPIPTAGLFMLSKLVLMPLLMVGLALAFNLDDNAGRAAVLIAALPVSMASFTLASKFKVGEAILSENVVLGTILLLPTILIWNIAMDAIDLFPVTKAA